MTIDLPKARQSPSCPAYVAACEAWFAARPLAKLSESPERMLQAVQFAAQYQALTDTEIRDKDMRKVLRAIRDGWPLEFKPPPGNSIEPTKYAMHHLTLDHIPSMYEAAMLWPLARSELSYALRWCEWAMLAPQAPHQRPDALFGTNVFVGLRALAMLRHLHIGLASAREVAMNGYGDSYLQWGVTRLLTEGFDEHGLPLFDQGRVGHWAWTSRQACVWLVRELTLRFTGTALLNYKRFRELPCKLLLAGGKSICLPQHDDFYGTHPIVGPIESWHGATPMDQWARWHARQQKNGVTFAQLFLPIDMGYEPTERPKGCTGNRNFGRLTIEETAIESVVKYSGDIDSIFGKAKAERKVPVTVTVTKGN